MARLSDSYDTLVFDLGNVLSPREDSIEDSKQQIDTKLLRRMMNAQIWYDNEAGTVPDEETYAELAKEFEVDESLIQIAVSEAMAALRPRAEMFDLIRTLKPGRKIYAMANMSASTWNTVKLNGASSWKIFDAIFLSYIAGSRKPELPFYRLFLHDTGSIPSRTIFVDDNREHLVTAQSLGMRTIFFDNFANVERILHNLCGDPVERASRFLEQNAKQHLSHTTDGQVIHENFSQLMILEATDDPSLVDYTIYEAEFNFFKGSGELTTTYYPDDLDTTSMAWTVIPNVADDTTKTKVMDRMLQFCDGDGIPLTCFDWNRPRRDHAICVNVLTLFHAYGRGKELDKAVEWIYSVLLTGAYMDGARYYIGPEPFLYFMLRLPERSPELAKRMGALFKQRCQERIGSPGDALALAMRLHLCNRVDLNNKIDFQRLSNIQQLDGGWEPGAFYRYGSIDLQFGNRGLSTAIAQRAIKEYRLKYGSLASDVV
ncbi:hypothetical protein HYPSUDRAFT_201024 [Hypholoma sublateritium FD-334 SS-4]|uniref:HAD-like protein n=1 Tax=Hypholoma sublateritium (strain FD-334 SS-4) TaxID=945553 RepID=A0A0D2MJM1_HYPSF|nr:hypothetical protein HYPSUDRAFT_201024 [Hypholoma sublateritium FD-334 SS-4]